MSTTKASLGNLPAEILARILTPLLQHTAEQAVEWNESTHFQEDRSYAQIMGPAPPKAESLQPQVLRVCKQFNEIGIALLYANNLVFQVHVCTYWADEQYAECQREFLKKLTLPRDERHRLRGLDLIIWTPDFYMYGSRDTDGDWLDELFTGLALHQPCWDQVNIVLRDLTARAAYNTDLKLIQLLMYGLGRFYAKSIPGVRDEEVRWCMEQPGHKYPLRVLHHYLDEYFDVWEPDNAEAVQTSLRKDEIRHRSMQAVESYDEDGFFSVMEEAIQHVNSAFRQGLKNGPWSPDVADKVVEVCQEEGRRLLSARDRKWLAAYRPKGVHH
ncbi:hypothetical protein LTS07_010637 [Exophiala sideris]|uniref:F-box domain-containing protein n=1 Tax=Exophiala sideris TaxID=1016849 RepID=A0ABR0IWR2_9EURO|nr:hypothetical protein LTS07_010637 [Exophiala sideris]KAK5025960.1 hypothetical protein LTR13_010273 [Exophiala sideris]KAK5050326.1 hypothetical protein LTR69_010661 [Exophiala sideris]